MHLALDTYQWLSLINQHWITTYWLLNEKKYRPTEQADF
ncbi:hypothetical protein PMIT1327_01527 [Prochlorococcus marinus str. MIT 1327]|nr:hypothetical protein PMIT1312_00140 [Prochlorococcus marinus str. MIT 1312]KZR79468.1 hypothetical protein PMIT1327_01527 [Prochlorococcus marinus str. MIT 1327]